jgi:putative endopeptidase
MSVALRPLTPLALALAALGCAKKVQPKPPPAPPQPVIVTKQLTMDEAGLSATAMNPEVDPCDDFYEFACGNWLKNTPIPPDRSVWNRSFSEIDKQNEETLKEILDRAIESKDGPDEVRRKLGQFYGACMDEAAIEKAGTKPLEKQLAAIKAIKDLKTLQAALVELHKAGVQVPFGAGAEQDLDDPTRYILGLSQGGLGLPNRDYYLSDDPKKKEAREAYLAHLARMLTILGLKPGAPAPKEPPPQAKQGAKDVLALETELAKVSKTPVEMRDPKGLNNKINREGVAKAAPDFPWEPFFKAVGQPELKDVNVTGVAFFEGMNKLLKAQKPQAWQAYLSYHLAASFAAALPKAFVDESFALQKALTGQEQLPERWKRCVDATDRALGELLAQPYVDRKFGPESKQATEQMVAEISTAFGNGLAKLDWMDDATREKARAKLKSFANHIGYPAKWKAYEWPVDPAYASSSGTSRTSASPWTATSGS